MKQYTKSLVAAAAFCLFTDMTQVQAVRRDHSVAPRNLQLMQLAEIDFDPVAQANETVRATKDDAQTNVQDGASAAKVQGHIVSKSGLPLHEEHPVRAKPPPTSEDAMRSCVISIDNSLFNLHSLSLADAAYQVSMQSQNKNYSINFNICSYASQRCPDMKQDVNDYANMIISHPNQTQECRHLSGDSSLDQKVTLQHSYLPEYGLQMKFKRGDQCPGKDVNKTFELTVQLNCNAGASQASVYLNQTSLLEDECSPHVIVSSPAGCPIFSMPSLWRWIDYNYVFVTFCFCATGLALLGFGGKHYMASISTMATLNTVVILVNILFSSVMPASTPQFMVWIIVIMTLGVASGTGYGAYHWPRFGIVTIFLFNGYLTGITLYTALFGSFDFLASSPTKITTAAEAYKIQSEETTRLWICIGVCSAICISLGLAFFDYAVIYASCISGSFLVVRGISLLLGGYPNEFIIYEALENGRFFGQQGTLFLYLSVMIVVAVFSIRHQLHKRKEEMQLYSYLKYDARFQGGLLNSETGDMADKFGEYLGNWFGRAKDKLNFMQQPNADLESAGRRKNKRRGLGAADAMSNLSGASESYEVVAAQALNSKGHLKGRKKKYLGAASSDSYEHLKLNMYGKMQKPRSDSETMSDAFDYQQPTQTRKQSKKTTKLNTDEKINGKRANLQLDWTAVGDGLVGGADQRARMGLMQQRKLNQSLHDQEMDDELIDEAARSPLMASGTLGDQRVKLTRQASREQAQLNQFLKNVKDKPLQSPRGASQADLFAKVGAMLDNSKRTPKAATKMPTSQQNVIDL